jgi:hypothetical protein
MPHDAATASAAPELPPPPAPRRRRWWSLRGRPTRKTPDRPCLNCGDPTVGFYCPTCGQKKVEVRVSLRRMLAEAVEDQFFMDLSLPRTVGALLFRPGHLTAEYVQGRIVRYLPPFRLYLVSSLLFFVLLPWLTNLGGLEDQIQEGMTRADSIAAAEGDTVRAAEVDTVAAGRLPGGGRARVTLGESNVNLNLGIDDTTRVPRLLRPANRHLLATEARLKGMPPGEAFRTVRTAFMENLPTGVFLMMPFFAGILKVLYVRRKRFYVEHFVFALHVHAFTFLTFLLLLLLPWQWMNAVLSLWLMLYVFLAMKRVYGQGFVKTAAKYLLLGWAYSLMLGAAVVFTTVLTALTL